MYQFKNKKWWMVIFLCYTELALCSANETTTDKTTSVYSLLDPLVLVQQALTVNPIIQSSRYEIQAAQLDHLAAQHQVFPTISGQLQASSQDYRSARFSVDQPLWTAGRLSANQQKTFFDYRVAIEGDLAERYNLASKVLDIWGSLLNAQANLQVATLTLSELEQFAAMMRRRVDSGVSARFELDLVESRILQTRAAYDNGQQLLNLSLVRLGQLLANDNLAQLSLQLPNLTQLSIQIQQNDLSTLAAYNNSLGQQHPLLKQTEHQAQSLRQQAVAVRASRYPQISLGYQYDNQHYDEQPSLTQRGGQVKLTVQYNTGAGLSNYLNEKALRVKADSLDQKKAVLSQQIADQIHQQQYSFLTAQGRIKTLEAAMYSSRLVQESYQRQFIAGRRSWLELMNATREIEQTSYDLSSARSSLINSYYQLLLLSGQLEPLLNDNTSSLSK